MFQTAYNLFGLSAANFDACIERRHLLADVMAQLVDAAQDLWAHIHLDCDMPHTVRTSISTLVDGLDGSDSRT